jgi:HlyD family secretion protein
VDIPRPRRPRALRQRNLWIALSVAALASGGLLVRRIEPRLDGVARASLWTGQVERGPFVMRVRGTGTLRPESIRWLTTESSGRVEEVLVKAGEAVLPDTAIARLENLDLRLQGVQASRDVRAVEAQLLAHDRQSREDELLLGAELAMFGAQLAEAQGRALAYGDMQGSVVSRLDAEGSQRHAEELQARESLSRQRLETLTAMAPRQRLGLEGQLKEAESSRRVRQEMIEHLIVRAAAEGILQDVLVELGQWVVPGTAVAKVIVSRRLQAELRIPAEQAGAINVGQAAQIRTGYDRATESILRGRVRRVAPAASGGTVTVEVALEGELPDGVRPDQSVDGSIETERTDVTLHLPRPAGVVAGEIASLFRVDAGAKVATRVQVRIGRVSVDSVEVLSGLQVSEEVILSDMSRHADEPAVRLE